MAVDQVETFQRVKHRVLTAAKRGRSLSEIDEQIIVPSGLDDDAQAALWILAGHEIRFYEARYAARQAQAFAHADGGPPGTD